MDPESVVGPTGPSGRLPVDPVIVKINSNFYPSIAYFRVMSRSKFNIRNILHIFT